jgi:hypothetical protein
MVFYEKSDIILIKIKLILNSIFFFCFLLFFFGGLINVFEGFQIFIDPNKTLFEEAEKSHFFVSLLTSLISLFAFYKFLKLPKSKYSFTNVQLEFAPLLYHKDLDRFEKESIFVASLSYLISLFGIPLLLYISSLSLFHLFTRGLNILKDWDSGIIAQIGFSIYFIIYSFFKSIFVSNYSLYDLIIELPYKSQKEADLTEIKFLVDYPKAQFNESIIFKEGQHFHVSFNENPSNSDEAETILITDANEHNFVVTKIQDKHLPYFLRKKEYELKAELKTIIGTKKLEIALWLEKI